MSGQTQAQLEAIRQPKVSDPCPFPVEQDVDGETIMRLQRQNKARLGSTKRPNFAVESFFRNRK